LPLPLLLSALLVLIVACSGPSAAGSARRGGEAGGEVAQASRQSGRTLRLVLRTEPDGFAALRLETAGPGTRTPSRLLNAGLALPDAEERPLPYLAERLPQLNTPSWQVHPDGRMDTTYVLRPGLTWHDGAPLTAQDFAFSWRVYTTTDFGLANLQPHGLMEAIDTPDARTVVIHWKAPFPAAAALRGYGTGAASPVVFTALPRHILERPYEEQRAGFATLPFWGAEYIGLGPYRLERWEPGAYIETVAFGGHALGRPKIERIRVTFSADFNSTLANMLAGEVDMPVDDSIRLQEGLILRQEWAGRDGGTVLFLPRQWRVIQVQMRPEYATNRLILDARIRKALAHSLDRKSIVDSLFEGQAIISDTPFPPGDPTGTSVERLVTRYPYDLRRTEALMGELGIAREGDLYSTGEGRVSFEIKNIGSSQNDSERSIMAHGWRQAGFEIEERTFTPTEAQDGQARASFRGLHPVSIAQGESAMTYMVTAQVSRAETRWNGQNRGGWSNAEFDRLQDAFLTTLDPAERLTLLGQELAMLSEQLPLLPLYFNPGVVAYPSVVRGVNLKAGDGEVSWNVHEWELR
jgi:peptide/nickel transport system substrate-binding protein